MKTPWGTSPREDVRKVVWYLSRRERHAELVRKVRHRADALLERALRVPVRATRWCREQAIEPSEAVRQLGAAELQRLDEVHPQSWRAAEERVAARQVGLGGGAAVDVLYTLVRARRPRRVLETGVANGYSSLAILTALDDNDAGRLVSTDLPGVIGADDLVGRAVGDPSHPRWTLLRRADRDAIPTALQLLGGFDFVHYDSDKSVEGRLWACRTLWPHLADGGLLMSDDINDNFAFRDFCREVGRTPWVFRADAVGSKFAGAIVK